MKILFLTQWFQPEFTFKGLPFAKELVRLGPTEDGTGTVTVHDPTGGAQPGTLMTQPD